MGSTLSKVTNVAGCGRRTLEVLLRFFVRQHVDPFVAKATQIDRTAFDTITRNISFVFLALTPDARNEMMRADPTPLTAV